MPAILGPECEKIVYARLKKIKERENKKEREENTVRKREKCQQEKAETEEKVNK